MTSFNPFATIAFLTAAVCLFLSALIFTYTKEKLHRLLGYFNLVVGGWAFFLFWAVIAKDPGDAYCFWKMADVLGSLVAIVFLHAVCIFCQLNFPRLIFLSYAYALFFASLNVVQGGGLIYKYPGVAFAFNSFYYAQARTIESLGLFSWWFFCMIFGHYQLFKYSKTHNDPSGSQAMWWCILSGLGFTGGCSTFLPMYGIYFYPFTLFLTFIYAFGLTYIIFKQEFLNIRIALERSLIYSALIAAATVCYLVSVVILEKIFQSVIGYRAAWASILSAFFIGFLFIPLRNRIHNFLDRVFFKGTASEIAHENVLLREEIVKTEKYKSLATVTKGIVQEIRNPLSAIMGYGYFLSEKSNDPEFIDKFSTVLKKEAGRINALLLQLAEYSHPAAPKLEITDVAGLVSNTVSLLKGEWLERNVAVRKDMDESRQLLLCVDPQQLRQAVMNILMNAIEAMPQGGELQIAAREAQEWFHIVIQDSGGGILTENLSRIFDPFFTTKENHTGLGLSTAQLLIENQGGRISVSSRSGAGARVVIDLPLGETCPVPGSMRGGAQNNR